MNIVVNIVLYQAGWFCCVLGAARGYPVAGGVAALVLTGLHVYLARHRKPELQIMLAALLIGVVVDSAQQALGVFTFTTDPAWMLWLPLWVFVIWAQFATLFHFALAWLQGRLFLAALFGAIGGPLAYYTGGRLGAASFPPDLLPSLIVLAVCWAIVTPLLVHLAGRFAPPEMPATYRFVG